MLNIKDAQLIDTLGNTLVYKDMNNDYVYNTIIDGVEYNITRADRNDNIALAILKDL